MYKKKAKETFTQSVFALMVSQVIVKLLGLLYRLYLTNRDNYGDEGNAISGASFQVYSLLLGITAIGIPNAISKLIAEKSAIGDHKGANKIFKISLLIFASIGIVGSYILFFYAHTIANEYLHIKEAELSIIALSPSIFLVSVISVLKGYFNGRESIKMTAKAQTMDQITKVIAVIGMIELSVFLLKRESTEIMAACSNLATTIGNIVELFVLIKSYIKDLPTIRSEIRESVNSEVIRVKDIVKNILNVSVPISLSALIATISKNIDSVTIIKGLKSKIGYELAKKQYGILSGKVDTLINLPLSFCMAIATALLPSIAATNGNIKEREKRINHAFLLEMYISIPSMLVLMVFSNQILGMLFPNAKDGGELLTISAISILFITIEQIANNILHAIGKTKVPVISIILGVISKAILNYTLVPKTDFVFGGTKGAAVATVVCHIITSMTSYIYLLKNTKLKISIGNFTKPLFASSILIVISKIMFNILHFKAKINLILALFIGTLVYLIILKTMKSLQKIGSKAQEYWKNGIKKKDFVFKCRIIG